MEMPSRPHLDRVVAAGALKHRLYGLGFRSMGTPDDSAPSVTAVSPTTGSPSDLFFVTSMDDLSTLKGERRAQDASDRCRTTGVRLWFVVPTGELAAAHRVVRERGLAGRVLQL